MEMINNNIEKGPPKIEEFWFEAVKRGKIDVQDVPEKFKTAEMCLEAMSNYADQWEDGNYATFLQFIPEELRTAEMCFEAVKWNGRAL